MAKIKLSEFVNMTIGEQKACLKKCNTSIKAKQVRHSEITDDPGPGHIYDGKKYAFDAWSDIDNFNIIEDECEWEVVPHIVTHSPAANAESFASDYWNYKYSSDTLTIKKKPKYGEVLFISFVIRPRLFEVVIGNFGLHENNLPIVLLDEQPRLFNGLPVSYHFYKDDKRRQRYLSTHDNGKDPRYVVFPYFMDMREDNRIADYAQEVENYAKFVSEHRDWYEAEQAVKPQLGAWVKYYFSRYKYEKQTEELLQRFQDSDYIVYMSLKYYAPQMGVGDYNKLYDLLGSNSVAVKKLTSSTGWESNKLFATANIEYEATHSMFGDRVQSPYVYTIKNAIFPDLCLFASACRNLEALRSIKYRAEDYEMLEHKALLEFEKRFKPVSDEYCKELAVLYKHIVHELARIETKYNKEARAISDAVVEEYSDVDLLPRYSHYKEPVHITGDQGKTLSFFYTWAQALHKESIFTDLVGNMAPDSGFKKHIKKVFDLDDELDSIVISKVSKCSDGPHEIFMSFDFTEDNYDLYDLMEEKWGEKKAEAWVEKLKSFDISGQLNELDGNDLYGGQSKLLRITKDYKYLVDIENE